MIGVLLQYLGVTMVIYLSWLWVTVPCPPGLAKPLLTRMLLVMIRVMEHVFALPIALGCIDRVQHDRDFARRFIKTTRIPHDFKEIRDTTFDGVEVRLYIPKITADRGHGALVYYHGGGWCLGDTDCADEFVLRLSRGVAMVVVSVNYRLAPEVKYPGALDDSVVAAKYLIQHAQEFGVDPERVAVGGDSAGGNLAAAVSLKMRDEGFSPVIKLQLLMYPCLQALDFSIPSMMQNQHGPILTRKRMAEFWSFYITGGLDLVKAFLDSAHTTQEVKNIVRQYLSPDHLTEKYKPNPSSDHVPASPADITDTLLSPYLCPLVAKDLRHLPAAHVTTCQYDVLRDEGMLYVQRLREVGVEVEHHHMTSGMHGIGSMHFLPESEIFMVSIRQYLNKHL